MKKSIRICALFGIFILIVYKNKEMLPNESGNPEIPIETLSLDDIPIFSIESTSETEVQDVPAVVEWAHTAV